jgi:uncharacterized membrane protein YhhN
MPAIVLALLAAVLDLLAVALGWHAIRVLTKPLPALILAVVAWRAGGRGARTLAAGLVLAAAGDELLLGAGDAAFLYGMLAFAAMQLAYILAYVKAGANTRINGTVATMNVLYVVALVFVLRAVVPHAGVFAAPLVVYAVLLLVMACLAAQMPAATRFGAAFFVLSDSLLAVSKFLPSASLQPRAAELVVMGTYVTAQILITLGMTRGPSVTAS